MELQADGTGRGLILRSKADAMAMGRRKFRGTNFGSERPRTHGSRGEYWHNYARGRLEERRRRSALRPED